MNLNKYQICTNCVMDTSDPDISFNENGVCNYCLSYKDYEKNYQLKGEQAKEHIERMVNKIQNEGKGNTYNCIMGLSGGVDSSYLAWYAVKDLGLNPLIVHVDSGWNSELAVNNIENIVNTLNLDLHTLVLDWNEMKHLQRAFFKASVPNCDIPQDHAFYAGLYSQALKYKIKSVLNGGNMQTEFILPKAWGYSASDSIHIKAINKANGNIRLKNYPMISYWEKYFLFPYYHRIKVYRPLEYIDYNKENAKLFLKEKLSWRDYGGKHYESFFTKFFQSYYLPTKFGFDKRKAHLSSLIVSHQLTRAEALFELDKPLYMDSDELEADISYFIKKLGFSRSEWNDIMNTPIHSHSDYKTEEYLHNAVKKYVKKYFKSFINKKL